MVADRRGVRATYSGGLLTIFDGLQIIGYVKLPEYYAEMVPCGPDILVWRRETVWVVNRRGRVVWRAVFPKQVGGVVADP